MSPKRANENLDSEKPEKAEKRQKLMCDGEVVNPGDDVEKECPPDLSSPQSTTEMVSLLTTMAQLEEYVRAGNQDAVRQLLTHQAINLITIALGNFLWTAYALERKEIAIMLVRHGADLTVRKHFDKRTLLHHILRGSQIKSATTRKLFYSMLDHGADVNARDNEGNTLLHDAITSRHPDSIKLAEELLKHGAQITAENEGNGVKNDIYLACRHKMQLLPKLIQHQDPDVQTRDRRAAFAIEYLISKPYTDHQEAHAALLTIEDILRLGVSVNVSSDPSDNPKSSFLNTALHHNNIAFVELLLKYGADLSERNSIGHTLLYQATAFKDTTLLSRLFIERGASIHARNLLGDYPVHGACNHESPKNLHLLLNLGADLNSVDRFGQTPFDMMKLKKKQKSVKAHELVIKYLALMAARGEQINEANRLKIHERGWSQNYFARCTNQLDKMKLEKVHNDASYFSLLSKNVYYTAQLVKDQRFIESFERDEKKRARMFPDYSYMLLHSFELSKKKLEILLAKKEELCKVVMGILPNYVLEKIAFYLCFEQFQLCHRDYFILFHLQCDFIRKRYLNLLL